jgi:hypothetical protein
MTGLPLWRFIPLKPLKTLDRVQGIDAPEPEPALDPMPHREFATEKVLQQHAEQHGDFYAFEASATFAKWRGPLSPDKYEIVDVRTSQGVRRAMLSSRRRSSERRRRQTHRCERRSDSSVLPSTNPLLSEDGEIERHPSCVPSWRTLLSHCRKARIGVFTPEPL